MCLFSLDLVIQKTFPVRRPLTTQFLFLSNSVSRPFLVSGGTNHPYCSTTSLQPRAVTPPSLWFAQCVESDSINSRRKQHYRCATSNSWQHCSDRLRRSANTQITHICDTNIYTLLKSFFSTPRLLGNIMELNCKKGCKFLNHFKEYCCIVWSSL